MVTPGIVFKLVSQYLTKNLKAGFRSSPQDTTRQDKIQKMKCYDSILLIFILLLDHIAPLVDYRRRVKLTNILNIGKKQTSRVTKGSSVFA